jgi:hypothetical protein
MANELDKTIEELEAEVLDELEEANGADAPKASAGKPDKGGKIEGDNTQDTGPAVVSPTQSTSPAKKVASAAKEVSGDASQKGEGKPDKMTKLAAGHVPEGEEVIAEMEVPKTKGAIMASMHKKMESMGAKELKAQYEKVMSAMNYDEDAHEETEEEKVKSEAVENRLKSIDVSEHVNALMNGEGDLSEEFKRKAATVFEAAVKSKVRSEVERMEDEYKSELEENINTTKEGLTEKVDTYLNYVVEEWMKENELAIERGLKGEIAEDFISGLKQLFEDHYVDVPDEKYDVLEAQSEKISELESRINEMMEEQIQFKSKNSQLVKEQVVSEVTSDLADTEIEKFKSLIEDVDFSSEESYYEKLSTLKESYFPKATVVMTEAIDDVETGIAQDIDTSGSMAAYMSAIGRTVNSAK